MWMKPCGNCCDLGFPPKHTKQEENQMENKRPPIVSTFDLSRKKPGPKPTLMPSPGSKYLRINSPNGDETWSSVTQQEITWEFSMLSGKVDLVLLRSERVGPGVFQDKEVGYIAKGLPISNGSFPWQVGDYLGNGYPPPKADPGDGYKIRVESVGTTFADESNTPFTILPRPELVLTTPQGGIWQPTTKLNISWRAKNFSPGTTVKIALYEYLSYKEDIAQDIPIEDEHFLWDISSTAGTGDFGNYDLYVSTMQVFWDDYFWTDFNAFSALPFYVIGYDLICMTTMYEGDIPYVRHDGFWIRDGASAADGGAFFRNYLEGFTDQNVQDLMNNIGCPVGNSKTDEDTWARVGILWNWLGVHGNITQDPDEVMKIAPNLWPSISEFAKYYKDHGQLVWGTCGSKAQLFANLLIALRIPLSKFAIVTARHNIDVSPAISQHLYIALYLSGRWFYIDPLASQNAPEKKQFPDFNHACSLGVDELIPRIDYEHPYSVSPFPESSIAVVPYIPK